MRNRALLIGSVLALLLVAIALVYPGQESASTAGAPTPLAPAVAVPRVGAEGIGDPYFPHAGNGGYDVTGYDIRVRYDPPTDRIVEGHTTITARATENLARFNLDLRLPASGITVNDRPAGTHQEDGELKITPAVPVRAGAPMTVRVDYAGIPSSVPP
jgi:hypothetical protein